MKTEWYQRLMWSAVRATRKKKWVNDYNISTAFHQSIPDAPFVMVGNHAHKLDPHFAGALIGSPVIHYMANIDGVPPLQQRLAHLVGAYPKKKGVADFEAVKHTFSLIRSGSAVGIFPEGDRSWDGETALIHPGTARLIRQLKVPIVVAHFRGHYLSWPRWADYPARGRIYIDYSVIPVEKSQGMTVEALQKLLESVLYQNDVKDRELTSDGFTCRNRAAGIQRVLWLCPSCGDHDTIEADPAGDSFHCNHCNTQWGVDGTLKITGAADFSDVKDWMDWQTEQSQKDLSNYIASTHPEETPFTTTSSVQVMERSTRRNKAVLDAIGTGTLALYNDRVEFTDPETHSLMESFPVSGIYGFIDNFNTCAEFMVGKRRIRLHFGTQSSYKWIRLVSQLQEEENGRRGI